MHAIATSRCLSDPVNTLTGAFVTSAEDLSRSRHRRLVRVEPHLYVVRPHERAAGLGWTDGYAVSLEVETNGDVRLHGDEGQIVTVRETAGRLVRRRSRLPLGADGLSRAAIELVRTDQVVYRFELRGASCP